MSYGSYGAHSVKIQLWERTSSMDSWETRKTRAPGIPFEVTGIPCARPRTFPPGGRSCSSTLKS